MPALMTWTGEIVDVGRFRITTGVVHGASLLYVVVGLRAQPDRLGPARVRRRRRRRGRPAGRHLASTGCCSASTRWPALIYGITAWILIGRAGAASPNAAADANLESITAVVIGGTSLFGGRGARARHPARRPHRRLLPHRPVAGRRGRPVPGAGRRRAGDHRRLASTSGSGRYAHEHDSPRPTSTQRSGAGALGPRPGQDLRPGRRPGRGRLRPLPGRGARHHRRQRRRQVHADQGRHRGARARTPARSALDGQVGQLPASAGRPRGRHRDGLPDPRGRAGARHRRQPVPRPRDAPAGPLGSVLRMLDHKGMRESAGQSMADLGIGTLQNMSQAVETLSGGQRQAVAVARAAAFGTQADRPRRAHRGARRQGDQPGALD